MWLFWFQASTLGEQHSLHITLSTFQKNSWADLMEKVCIVLVCECVYYICMLMHLYMYITYVCMCMCVRLMHWYVCGHICYNS